MAKKDNRQLYLSILTYPSKKFVTVKLKRRDGSAHEGLLWGELNPGAAGWLAAKFKAAGFKVEEERALFDAARVIPVAEDCLQQHLLFDEEPE